LEEKLLCQAFFQLFFIK